MARNVLPEGWGEAPVGGLFEMQLGKMLSQQASAGANQAPYLANRHVQWDEVRLEDLDAMSFSEEERIKYRLIPGDLLVCEGGEVGRTALWKSSSLDVFFQKAIHRLRTSSSEILPGYMLRFIRRASDCGALRDLSSQTSIAHLTREKLATLVVPLPPIREQQFIAAILDTLDETIRKTEQVLEKLKQMKQGLLHDLLTRGIDENGELRDPERHPEQFKDSELGRIPREWGVAKTESLCTEICVGIVVRPTQYYRSSGVPILRGTNIVPNDIDATDLRFMSMDDHRQMLKTSVSPGDLVTVRTGAPGTTAVIPQWLPTANCVDIIVTRPGQRIESRFLSLWINSDSGKGQVLRMQGGLAQQHFNVAEMRDLITPIPSIIEQARIVERFSSALLRMNEERSTLHKLRALKTALMDDLLTGRVRTTSLLENPP